LDAYYSQAGKDANQQINRALAAQGLLGSGYGANQVVNAQTRLAAERAGREAEFGLQQRDQAARAASAADANRLGLINAAAGLAQGADNALLGRTTAGFGIAQGADSGMLGRLGLMGTLGSAYDQGDLARTLGIGGLGMDAQRLGLGRQQLGLEAAMGADKMDLSRATAGMDAAQAAQLLSQGRGQQLLDNQFRQQAQMQQQRMLWDEMLANRDQALMDAQFASLAARNQAAMDDSARRRGQNQHLFDTAVGVGAAALGVGA
jgi:hypothetical protein